MGKQVAVNESKAVNVNVMDFGSFGVENVITSDLRIPKILLMQSMSDFVAEKKAYAGDIVESFEGRKLGDEKAPVQIIPFYMTNTWTVKKEVNGKMEFEKVEDRGGNDIQREYEFVGSDGVKRTNHRTLNIFCLIKGGNLQVPYMISLQNKSFGKAAQPYLNKTQLLKTEGKAPAHIVFNLGVGKEENEKGKWFSNFIEAAKDSNGKDVANTPEEVQAAYNQYIALTGALKSGQKIDMSDIKDTHQEESNVKY
jgi:hypothetical protein